MIQIDDNLKNSNHGYLVDAVKCPSHITGATQVSYMLSDIVMQQDDTVA